MKNATFGALMLMSKEGYDAEGAYEDSVKTLKACGEDPEAQLCIDVRPVGFGPGGEACIRVKQD